MELFSFVLAIALGAFLLYQGAEWLVDGAAGLARSLGISALVVGLTIVAYATSAPEFVVSAVAALDGKDAIVLGNVIGSNIANLGLVLGLTALFIPPLVHGSLIKREVPVMLVATLAVPLALMDGIVDRVEGSLFFIGAIAFTIWVLKAAKKGSVDENIPDEKAKPGRSRTKMAMIGIAGLVVLLIGGKVLVFGATGLATILGMSERLIGLTIVAIGTSLPELAASIVAALRGHSSMAVGNVVGSNIFNILFVLGGTSMLHPVSGQLGALSTELYVLAALMLVSLLVVRRQRHILRLEGAILFAVYLVFIAILAINSAA